MYALCILEFKYANGSWKAGTIQEKIYWTTSQYGNFQNGSGFPLCHANNNLKV